MTDKPFATISTKDGPSEQLKTCPFCGSRGIDHDSYWHRHSCTNCGARGPAAGNGPKADWNTRATEAQHAADLEAVREAFRQRMLTAIAEYKAHFSRRRQGTYPALNEKMVSDLCALDLSQITGTTPYVPKADLDAAQEEIAALREASDALGFWLSAALEDNAVCDEMKGDINRWFAALAKTGGK